MYVSVYIYMYIPNARRIPSHLSFHLSNPYREEKAGLGWGGVAQNTKLGYDYLFYAMWRIHLNDITAISLLEIRIDGGIYIYIYIYIYMYNLTLT